MMEKLVNVRPTKIINRFNPPLKRTMRKIIMNEEQIRICIAEHAMVDEVLPDGSLLRLDFSNYNTDNNPAKEENIQKAVPDKEPTGDKLKDIENKRLTKRERRELKRKNQENIVKTNDIEG